jgi:anaerobic carbon-monoxide dehydrogenase iron sulfur subunit
MRYVVAKEEVCIGCRLCEIACIVEHSRTKDIVKTYREENRPVSRAHVEEEGPVSLSITCRHCEDAWCVSACITGAMHRLPDGRVLVDTDKCVGCWSCVMACRVGAVAMDEAAHKSAKCDLCPDRSTPACVEACPNGALIVVEEEVG